MDDSTRRLAGFRTAPSVPGGENPWLERRILNYGHQGGSREAPSSTLHAFDLARANGADALEMDVHRTADGVLVVCHDASVDRTTNASGLIASLPLARLRELDNAYWWAPGHDAVHDLPDGAYPLRGRAPEDPRLTVATLERSWSPIPTSRSTSTSSRRRPRWSPTRPSWRRCWPSSADTT